MQGTGATRAGVLLALLVGAFLLIVMTPSAARAAWKGAEARIVDRNGTGYVSLLNVRVANQAVNDSATVTEVQFSDDGVDWLGAPYTGQAQDWVLAGESGAKTLYVRFAAADGSLSPVVETRITVDTQGPRTRALRAGEEGSADSGGEVARETRARPVTPAAQKPPWWMGGAERRHPSPRLGTPGHGPARRPDMGWRIVVSSVYCAGVIAGPAPD